MYMTFLEMLEQPFGAICQDEKGMHWRVARNRKGMRQIIRISKVRGGLKANAYVGKAHANARTEKGYEQIARGWM